MPNLYSLQSQLSEYIETHNNQIYTKWFSFIHIIPVMSLALIFNAFARLKFLDFLASIFLIVVMIGISYSILMMDLRDNALAAGYILSMIGLVGIIYHFIENSRIMISEKESEVNQVSQGISDIIIRLLIFLFFFMVVVAIYSTTLELIH